jgi:hypothetical protein
MNAGRYVIALAALATPLVAKSPGPIRLLSCVVSNAGLLEAEVENTADSAQACTVRCNYLVGETSISHRFEVSIPAGFSGIVGQFDTSRGQPGSYPGHLGACRVVR